MPDVMLSSALDHDEEPFRNHLRGGFVLLKSFAQSYLEDAASAAFQEVTKAMAKDLVDHVQQPLLQIIQHQFLAAFALKRHLRFYTPLGIPSPS